MSADFKIILNVKDVSDTLILREDVGEGEFNGKEFKVSAAMPTHSIVVEIEEKMYVVNIHDISKAVLKKHEENQ